MRRTRRPARPLSRQTRPSVQGRGRLAPRYRQCPRSGNFLRERRLLPLSYFEKAIKKAGTLAKYQDFGEARKQGVTLERQARNLRHARAMLLLGEAFHKWGYESDAERCCDAAMAFANHRTLRNMDTKKNALYLLCGIASESANHEAARNISRRLLRIFPFDNGVLLYHIFHMSYEPEEHPRRQKAWAMRWARSVMPQPGTYTRPKALPLDDRPLRVGYVSADFDLHPVGFFVQRILPAHDPARIQAFAYNNGDMENPIAKTVALACTVRDVRKLNDEAMADRIRNDKIDVLVDLSGYTAGNRLPVFAREPAPVLVSWLGYWATTGLSCMDAVLLDPWHAHEGTQQYFAEPVVQLPVVRFCFQSVDDDIFVNPTPPCIRHGHITFGSFNNTSKLTSFVLDAWARILTAVPRSRLLLKWKSFHEPAMRERIWRAFTQRGITRDRLIFSLWSSHKSMMAQYNDVDIMLDSFPFTGGMTTCNALWMGVPVVTLAGESVVARQGHAILGQLGLEELSAHSVDHYVNIAVGLASNIPLLTALRLTLRKRMKDSPLMDVKGFTRHLEDTLLDLYNKKVAQDADTGKDTTQK